MDVKKTNDSLREFWDDAIVFSDEDRKEALENKKPLSSLAPSIKLFEAAKELAGCDRVLDYGCGSGWGGAIIADNGCCNVEAVDLGANIVESATFTATLYNLENHMHVRRVSPSWIHEIPEGSYDGLFCSNVLDVVPLETAMEILSSFHRILKPNAKAVVSLNFYMSKEAAERRGVELVEGKYLFANGVLRLTSLSDQEWIALLEPWFDVVDLQYFAWPGEAKETRRLFKLVRKP